MKVDEAGESKANDQREDVVAAMRWMNQHKIYDRAELEQRYKDKDFQLKERSDVNNLQMAIKFVREQIEIKRKKIKDLERETKQARHSSTIQKINFQRTYQ